MKQENVKKENPPEKVRAMFAAVLELLEETDELRALKVADITARAGIGKGTAYEYFSSKEELIARALAFEAGSAFEGLIEQSEKRNTFRGKTEYLLSWLSEHLKQRRLFLQMVQISTGAYEMSRSIREEFKKAWHENKRCEMAEEYVRDILEAGKKEGLIKTMDFSYAWMAFYSQIMAYVMYLAQDDSEKPIPKECMGEFTYGNIIKLLN